MINQEALTNFIQNKIVEFHDARIAKIRDLKLDDVLKRKNPYLFKAKNIETAGEFVSSILDAYLSSQEETLFGTFVESLAKFVCEQAKGGIKSCADGMDLEFTEDGTRYIISVKSGPNWGNKGQIDNMKKSFKKAIIRYHTQNPGEKIVCVNGCCYGKDSKPFKGDYYKYCGEEFWAFISGEEDFYLKIIAPLDHGVRSKNEYFKEEFAKVNNKFTKEFIGKYCNEEGAILWDKLLEFVSKKPEKKQKGTSPKGKRRSA